MFIPKRNNGGYLLVTVLVFSSVLLTIIISLIGFVVVQNRLVATKAIYEQAGQIAEAGLNYYKWYLAHNPGDFTHGTGVPGPYVFVYQNDVGEPIGEYHISIEENQFCGQTTSARVVSVGHTYNNPSITRRISARYARPSVADFSFVSNSSSYVEPARTYTGPYHSNGGVHMNGTHFAPVTSSVSDWSCTPSTGCAATTTQPGVVTTGGGANESLFAFPVPTIDFAGLALTLAEIKATAISGGGIYHSALSHPRQGYHLIFLADGRVQVRRVNGTAAEPSGYAWGLLMNVINNSTLIATHTINPSCPVIFIEDNVWVEGVVNGKVTLGVGNLTGSGSEKSTVLHNQITYANPSSRFLVLSQQDINIGLEVPTDMIVNGVFIAKDGQFKRNQPLPGVPPPWATHNMKNSLTINGTVMTNGPIQTKWYDSSGTYISGFNNHTFNYDRNFTIDPPPFMPHTSDMYRFFEWRDGE
jgi:hypothetical protein